MRFDGVVQLTAGVTGPDPIASPQTVPSDLIVTLPALAATSSEVCQRLILGLIAPLAEDVTCSLWALGELGRQDEELADRVFLLIAAAVNPVGRTLLEVTGPVPIGGPIYVQVTADNLVGTRELGIACAA